MYVSYYVMISIRDALRAAKQADLNVATNSGDISTLLAAVESLIQDEHWESSDTRWTGSGCEWEASGC